MNKWIAEFELEDGDTMPECMDLIYKGAKIGFHCKPLKQEPCEDAISRQYLLDNCVVDKVTMPYVPISKIQEAPPANQQEPKTGHWIDTDEGFSPCECSECESVEFIKSKFCPNCGARMAESEES